MHHKQKNSMWRYYFVYAFLIILLSALVLRLVQLNVVQRNFLLSKSNARIIRKLPIPASRGIIYDRNGVPLAITASVKSIWINPQIFSPTVLQLSQLSHLLKMSVTLLA